MIAQGSFGNILKRNTATDNLAGIALNRTNNNFLKENISTGSGDNGFEIVLSDGNTFRKNIADNNGTGNIGARSGIALSRSNNNIFTENIVSGNAQLGFHLLFSNNNTLTNNTATANRMFGGFALDSSGNNILTENIANANEGFGYSDNSTGIGTAATANNYIENECADNLAGGSSPTGLCSPQP